MKRSTVLFVVIPALTTALPAQGQQPPQDPGQAFVQRFDTDKDGKVSLEEFLAPGRGQFQAMDHNGDGFVSVEEARATAEEHRRRMEQMRRQQGQPPGR